jgi:hypothetical protein
MVVVSGRRRLSEGETRGIVWLVQSSKSKVGVNPCLPLGAIGKRQKLCGEIGDELSAMDTKCQLDGLAGKMKQARASPASVSFHSISFKSKSNVSSDGLQSPQIEVSSKPRAVTLTASLLPLFLRQSAKTKTLLPLLIALQPSTLHPLYQHQHSRPQPHSTTTQRYVPI